MKRLLAMGLVLAAAVAAAGCSAGFTASPTYVTDISATLNGIVVTSDGGPTSYWVEYGTSRSYGHESTHRTKTVPAKSSFLVSIPIAGLSPGTTYHYRLCAERCSDDAVFTTTLSGASRSGIAIFSNRGPGSPFTSSDVIAMDADGANPVNLTNSATTEDVSPAWSPDARQIAYIRRQYDSGTHPVGAPQIYVMNADGSNKHAVTNDSVIHREPAWSPHGEEIAFTGVAPSGHTDIYLVASDGGTPLDLTNTPNSDESNPAWSPDASRIAYTFAADASSLGEIYVMNVDGTHKVDVSNSSLNDDYPAWSPDGTRIAFARNVSGTRLNDIFAMDADGSNQVALTTFDGHESEPSWSPDGTRIAYENGGEEIFVLAVATGSHPNITNNNPIADFAPAWSPRP